MRLSLPNANEDAGLQPLFNLGLSHLRLRVLGRTLLSRSLLCVLSADVDRGKSPVVKPPTVPLTSPGPFSMLWLAAGRPLSVKRGKRTNRRKNVTVRSKLRLPDLDQARSAVLNSLRSLESQRSYRYAIDEFIGWYCSEPRLSFNKTDTASISNLVCSRRERSTADWQPSAALPTKLPTRVC